MSKHPYPKHVITDVAKALMKSSETRDAFGAGGDWEAAGHTIKQEFVDHAETALQTLWDASRVDSEDEAVKLHHRAILIDKDHFWTNTADEVAEGEFHHDDFPAHVIFWGDAE